MSFEYSVWAKGAMWEGENDESDFPDFHLQFYIVDHLRSSATPPPYLGSVKKQFDSLLTSFFLDFDNTILSPADARETARWLRSWAEGSVEPLPLVLNAYNCADWLTSAADHGWYVDWSV